MEEIISKREQNRKNTIDRIHSAFLSIYSKKGIEGVTIKELCTITGIVKSTFYTYYEDKYSILDDIKNKLLESLSEIIYDLTDIDVNIVEQGISQEKAYRVITFIRANRTTFKAMMGPHGDPSFEIRWRNDIQKSFASRFKKETGNARNTEITETIFTSSLLGIYRYMIFNNPDITSEDFAILLGNVFKYALLDFQTFAK